MINALILWFLKIPSNVRKQVSATKLAELCLVIFLEYRGSEDKFDNAKTQLIESVDVPDNLL